MSRQSLFGGFRVTKLDNIPDEMREAVDCKAEMADKKITWIKEFKSSPK